MSATTGRKRHSPEQIIARLRDELLDREEFGSLTEARVLLEDWREQYNQERPHSALGNRTPEEFASSRTRQDEERVSLTADSNDNSY